MPRFSGARATQARWIARATYATASAAYTAPSGPTAAASRGELTKSPSTNHANARGGCACQ
ncbi:hypothetical protein BE04_08080 [Sorangium cellulosum]|uniref:Uncharacterized protein n=1 Tax=Sorangium cellulosum TaxID=56 RepID=A0A150P8F1_SORCE|nr:hypothetical protein BE04_08080 [Sorangium cellulosum]